MAVVPTYGQPEVQQRPLGTPYQDAAGATPAAFGAVQGQALAGLGAAGAKIGAEGMAIAAQMHYSDIERAAKDGHTAQLQQNTNLLWGDGTAQNPGFLNLKGEAAVAALPGVQAQLQKIHQTIGQGIQDKAAQQLYGSAGDATVTKDMELVNRFGAQQRSAADLNSSNARIATATTRAMLQWNDPQAVETQLGAVEGEVKSKAIQGGWSDDVYQQQLTVARSGVIDKVVRSAALQSPELAASMLTRYGPQIDAPTTLRLQEHLHPKLEAAQARSAVGGDWAAATGVPGSGSFDDNVRVESGGNQFGKDGKPLTSSAGAVGAAQLMPSTARDVAQAHGITFDADRLANDKGYNVQLGSLYHGDLMKKYGGNRMLADAAYNAGPGAVDGWRATIGDPNKGEISNQQFAASIPYPETRAYVQKTGSAAPPATAAQLNGFVYPDRAAMTQKILDRTAGDPEQQHAQLSLLGQHFNQLDIQVAGKRTQLAKQSADLSVALQSGRTDVDIPEGDIRAVFPKEKADEMVANLQEDKTFGQLTAGYGMATPEQRQAVINDLSTGTGPISAMARIRGKQLQPGADPDAATAEGGNIAGLARQQRLAARAIAWNDKINAQIKLDPAAYVMQDPSVKQAFADAGNDPAKLHNAVLASKAAQMHVGVPEDQTQVLTNDQIAAQVHQLQSVDPEKGDMGAKLDAMAKQYGDLWPDVMGDLVKKGKLAPEYQTLATMDQPSQAGTRVDYQRAVQMKTALKTKFDDAVPADQKQPLKTGVLEALRPMQASLGAGGQQTFNEVILPSASTLATYYASTGMSGDDAAKKAVKAIIDARYEFADKLRVPKIVNGQAVTASDATAAGAGVVNSLTAGDLKAGGPNPITLAEAQSGSWRTLPDETGAYLVAMKTTGQELPVRRADGSLVSMKFGALPQARSMAPPPVPLGMTP